MQDKKEISDKGYTGLTVYQMAYRLAMEIFEITKTFPKEEKYSLTDQIRRSSRSVSVNIASGYRRRKYPKHFSSKMTDADEECTETIEWLKFSKDCQYINEEIKTNLNQQYEKVGRMLGSMADNPEKFLPKGI
ncbi:MAG: four helix bundle protein [Bacteroidetes bacterium]|nr:four helix bundle protein [Bacteroidota bacterium]